MAPVPIALKMILPRSIRLTRPEADDLQADQREDRTERGRGEPDADVRQHVRQQLVTMISMSRDLGHPRQLDVRAATAG